MKGSRSTWEQSTTLFPRDSGPKFRGTGRAALRPRTHIPSLDGLRAVSFGFVFLGHADLNAVVPGPFGVMVCVFLSGYLITTLFRVELKSSGTVTGRSGIHHGGSSARSTGVRSPSSACSPTRCTSAISRCWPPCCTRCRRFRDSGSSPAGLAISLVLAWVMHVAVERPCARLRAKFSTAAAG